MSLTPGQKVPLVVGMLGWSAQNIHKGKPGNVWFPVGDRDDSFVGGRRWVKIRVVALEDVREKRDIIVADDELNVKEHTPVELSYETLAGPFQRVTERYPLPTIPYFADEAGDAQKTSKTQPVPVTAGSKAITYSPSLLVTAQGNTILVAPKKGEKIRVHYYLISNPHVAAVDVGMRFGDSGDIKHSVCLAPSGGTVNANLIDCNWEGAKDETLFAYLAAPYANGVYFTIGYTSEKG